MGTGGPGYNSHGYGRGWHGGQNKLDRVSYGDFGGYNDRSSNAVSLRQEILLYAVTTNHFHKEDKHAFYWAV